MRKLRVGIVSSVGGHLTEALELLPELLPYELFLVLNDEAPWRNEPQIARRYRIVHAERDARLLVNCVEAARILFRERPDVLISMGASPAVPFFGLARLCGIKTIFIESFAAVEKPTLTGRLLHRLADHFFVQWPELLPALPRARYAGPIFTRQTPPADSSQAADSPAELLVAVGSSAQPFRRLLDWLDALAARRQLPQPTLVQCAADDRPHAFQTVPFLATAKLEAQLRTAAVIVCHGGAGMLGACLKWGRHPIVVPRRAAFGEVVNDHQLMLCRALASRGLITVCESEAELALALKNAARPSHPPAAPLISELRPAVAEILRALATGR